VGRSVDVDTKHLPGMIAKMAAHKGVSFLEVFQNCNIFNDKAFEHFTAKTERAERMLYLEPGQPLKFGAEGSKGIRVRDHRPEIVTIGDNASEDQLLRYDPKDPTLAYLVSQLDFPEFPVPVGVFVDIERPTYEDLLTQQVEDAKAKGTPDLQALLTGPNTWTVS